MMFIKLRNQFLIVSMVTIFLIMFIAFASIYMITCQKVNSDINAELQKMYNFYHKTSEKDEKFQGNDIAQSQVDDNTNTKKGHSLTFVIKTDSQWNITETESKFDFNNEFYELVQNEVATQGLKQGRFNLDDNNWAYIVHKEESGYAIYSLDITSQLRVIENFMYSFIVVGFMMLVIIFFTNRFFANRYIAPVKEAFIKQKQFIADASHEIKTPLAVISTNTDVLLSNSEDTIHNQSKWLNHIKMETERMKSLTDDLLYLTEIDNARMRKLFIPFNISEAVESIILTMEAVIFEKNIRLNYEIEPKLSICGNREQIEQLVMILVDNAIKYTNPNGSITLTLKKLNQEVLLSVSNTGAGISPEQIDRIFDRFYRTDASRSRKHRGYGLGLAIAKSIIKHHNGKIYAKSTMSKFTTFYVHLH